MKFYSPVLLSAFVLLCLGCEKDPVLQPVSKKPATSDVVLRFQPVAAGVSVNNDTSYYANSTGDVFTITKFNYYISHVKLKNVDGSVYIEKDSYHLIRHMEAAELFTLSAVPSGTYTHLSFLIGVDSARNVSGAQSGALDPANNMFWDWNSGYIFYKLEGSYASLSGGKGEYAFHIGGFADPENRLQEVELNVSGNIVVQNENHPLITLTADAAEIFSGPHQISFDDYFIKPPSPELFTKQSQNYSDMFAIGSITY